MKQINPARGTDSVEIDFALDQGTQFEITSVDSARQPISRVMVIGMTPDCTLDMASEANVRRQLVPIGRRAHDLVASPTAGTRQSNSASGLMVRSTKLTVRLEPCAKVIGRIVDKDQVPVPRAKIRFDILPPMAASRSLPIYHRRCRRAVRKPGRPDWSELRRAGQGNTGRLRISHDRPGAFSRTRRNDRSWHDRHLPASDPGRCEGRVCRPGENRTRHQLKAGRRLSTGAKRGSRARQTRPSSVSPRRVELGKAALTQQG